MAPCLRFARAVCADVADRGSRLGTLGTQALVARGLSAKEWAESIAAVLDGKSGGNEKTAQGVGNNLGAIKKAHEVALAFARSKLGSK